MVEHPPVVVKNTKTKEKGLLLCEGETVMIVIREGKGECVVWEKHECRPVKTR